VSRLVGDGRRAAFFDLDDTLTTRNTGELIVGYLHRTGRLSRREVLRFAWLDLQFRWGLRSFEGVAGQVAESNRGDSVEELDELMREWFEAEGRRYINRQAVEWLEAHRARGDLVAINTSGSRFNTLPIARHLGVEHILCTELEVVEGRFTGRIVPPVCFGKGKLLKAEEFCRGHGVSLAESSFYTDSHHDLPLLLAVGRPIVVNPSPRLYLEALRRGWEVRRAR
jgi:HAD superfamily hydrolase (TIGR01490 family)